jgi:eukaryotic-like serine/threonine-protein kinase
MRLLTAASLAILLYTPCFTQSIMFQSDAAHTGTRDVRPGTIFGDAWTFQTAGKVFSSPVFHKGKVYFGSEDGYVYALQPKSGKLVWKFKTGGAVHTTPALIDNRLYVGSFDGFYYCLDSNTGIEKWKFKTGGERWPGGKGYFGMKPDTLEMNDPWDFFLSSPIVESTEGNVTVFFGSSDHYIYALNGKTGTLQWKFQTDGIVHSTPAVSDGVLYAGSWDASLYALQVSTGKLLWKFETGKSPVMTGIQPSPTVANGMVYFGARDAAFYALDAKTGEMKWKYDAEGSWILSTAAVDGNTLYVGTSDTYLVLAIDALSGKEKWRRKLFGYVYGSPCLATNALFIGDFTGRIFSIDPVKGDIVSTFETNSFKENAATILKKDGTMSFQDLAAGRDMASYLVTVDVMNSLYKLGPVVSSGAIADDRLFIGSSNGKMYGISLKKF